jgi:CheY-like chemotaxis protein
MATPRALADSSSSSVLLSLIAQADDPMAIAGVPPTFGDDAPLIAANTAFCQLTARSLDELIDRGWLTLCSKSIDPLVVDRVRRALYRREHLAIALPLARADGIDAMTHCELLPIRDARGVATAVLILQRDISEALQARETLAALRAMTRRTSHEVNNELASVIINLSLASSQRASNDDRREHIRDALRAARGAAETAKRLSALATDWDTPADQSDSLPGAPSRAARARAVKAPQEDATDASAAVSAAVPPEIEAAAEPAEEPERIGSLLILEDDEIVKSLLANYLGGRGFDVDATTESGRCVELYRDAFNAGRRFDLVILDLRIGRAGMGGMETLAALQAIDPEVQAIAHSGYSTDDVMMNPTEFGFVESIKKPTPPSHIASTLAELIQLRANRT